MLPLVAFTVMLLLPMAAEASAPRLTTSGCPGDAVYGPAGRIKIPAGTFVKVTETWLVNPLMGVTSRR
jgi:hypothetical protein